MSGIHLKDLSKVYKEQIAEKKDDSYLETDMKKRQKNNEKARKDMKKMGSMSNPHFGDGPTGSMSSEEVEVTEADSLAAMAARREKRLAAQRKKMGTSSTGQDFGHDYGISSAERKKRQQAEFDKFVGKKTQKEGLDPVGKEDGDVNNDGKEDDTDDYLMNRRKAVGKAIAKKKGKKSVNEQSYLDQLKASEKAMREEEKAAIRANAEKNMQALDRAGGAIKALDALRKQASPAFSPQNDPNLTQTAPGIYKSKSAIEAGKTLQQRLRELPSNVKRRQVDAAREKRMMAAPIPEEFITDGATGTTSTEGQNAREIDVLPDKVAKKLQQVTVMPQDGTNPQVGKAPLMMSQQMEGEQLTEEEEDRRERYAFMNVARNLVRAKTGAKRPIAMDPEGTYKKAKEDLAKMVNSDNPDKDKKETPCEEKAIDEGVARVLKTAAKIAGAAGGTLAAGKALEKATSSKEPTRDEKDAADAKKHLDHYGKTGKMIRKEGKQLSMADTFKQIAEGGVPSQDGQVDEYKRRAQEADRKRKMNPDGTPRKPQPHSTGGGGYNKYKLPSRPADGSGTGI